jgi:predicted protein tyrosine phosphatase
MQVFVCNRKEAERLLPPCKPHAWISIATPGDPNAKVATNEHTKDVLRLSFSDLDRDPGPSFREVYGEPVMFTSTMAHQIAAVANVHDTILIHCDAGVSRSAAVAEALRRVCSASVTSTQCQCPNQLVLKTLCEIMRAGM